MAVRPTGRVFQSESIIIHLNATLISITNFKLQQANWSNNNPGNGHFRHESRIKIKEEMLLVFKRGHRLSLIPRRNSRNRAVPLEDFSVSSEKKEGTDALAHRDLILTFLNQL